MKIEDIGVDAPTSAADTRTQILVYARRLNAERRFGLAEQLLQAFLVAAYRDVEARVLLAEAFRGQNDFHAAIDHYYEARLLGMNFLRHFQFFIDQNEAVLRLSII